jgi:hypothetical protein
MSLVFLGETIMFYKKLAKEYTNEAKLLKKHIEKLKKELAKEIANRDINVCHRMSILTDMYLDLKFTGKMLEFREQEYV